MGFDEEDKKVKDVETSEPHALVGSRSEEYGGWSDLFYDQFELLSTVSKKHQIVLLKVPRLLMIKYRLYTDLMGLHPF